MTLALACSAVLLGSFKAELATLYSTKTLKSVRTGEWSSVIRYPVFRADSAVIRLANRNVKLKAQSLQNGFFKQIGYELPPGDNWGKRFGEDQLQSASFKVTYIGQRLLCIRFKEDTSIGVRGNHGMTYFHHLNFGIVNGKPKRLMLADLGKKGSRFSEVISKTVIAKLMRTEGAYSVQEGDKRALDINERESFAIARNGLVFTFDPYVMGPFSSGWFEVTVPFREIRSLIDPMGPLRGIS